MAATDKPYRNQYRLDVVFGVSCVLLLLSTVWMMYDDHYKPWKRVQRTFRDVEEALYVQQMVEKYPEDRLDEVEAAQKQVDEAKGHVDEAKKHLGERIKEADPSGGGNAEDWLKRQGLEKARLDAQYLDTKASYDSEVSLYNIAVDERDKADGSHREQLDAQVKSRKQLIEKLDKELADLQHRVTENQNRTDFVLADQKKAEDELATSQDRLRKMTNDFDRVAKLAAQKRWKKGDWFRSLPILDAFASAYKVQQFSLEDLTIEYGSFKNVPRYDRCTTCHLGIDRASFDPTSLRNLDLAVKAKAQDMDPADLRKEYERRHAAALKFLRSREQRKESLGFEPGDLGSDVPSVKLTDAQVRMYAAHPRLNLFVESNSAHPAEKFGCTICHAGQGSATDFALAAHTPNSTAQQKEWAKEHDWEPVHDWEFPMLPARFVESGCVKCHHQMTDLISQGSKEEAPKVLRGYNLVREYGCFGCHEISGLKSGKEVGPDLRLEPNPALESLSPEEQAKLLADPGNPPGTMRKVGPALRRISEKTNEEWVRKWINSPRGFRPDTRMPHFYNLSTNSPDVLPEDQKKFPATEISSIAYYLMTESQAYLHGTDRFRRFNQDRLKELEDLQRRGLLSDKQAKELIEVKRRLEQWKVPTPVVEQIVDAHFQPIPADKIPPPGNDADRQKGRQLFTERGCLACHSHAGTETKAGAPAAVTGEAHFGPNLSRLAAKVSGNNGRRWLIQWIVNPNVSHPRTRMPITLTEMSPSDAVKAASQIADWLLSQTDELKDPQYQEWNKDEVPAPTREDLVNLARVFLRKAPAVDPLKVDEILEKGLGDIKAEAPMMAEDADEQVLKGPMTEDKLKYYIGKKAVGRMGCFGCHDIPGFEYAKPIGTPLNDWGKKDPARLAFEDSSAYVHEHFDIVAGRNDPQDPAQPSEAWAKAVAGDKKPYEKFFADALDSHQREGFLHLKLEEPRSYDYHRDVRWDDRLRMPQFHFAPVRKNKGEDEDAYKARASVEEAQGREAVMTFILGLVAEPIHARYLSNPGPDRMAEVKGRQVLDKFNCSGCHLVRSGVYEFKLDDSDGGTRTLLDASYKAVEKDKFRDDHVFANDNAWVPAQPPVAERITIHGANPRLRTANDEKRLTVRLTDAAAWQSRERKEGEPLIAFGAKGKAPVDGYRETLVLPAGNDVRIDPARLIEPLAPPFGGTFGDLMVPYVIEKDRDRYKDADGAREALPPPLVREGQKVQTEWLYNFLRNPVPIRAAPVMVLRMPKFNMSEEDARALVNYFAAADKTNNPGIGLTYPYLGVPEREDFYWREQALRYWQRIGTGAGLEARIKKLQDDDLARAKKAVDDAKEDAARKQAQGKVVALEAKLKVLKDLAARPDEAATSLYWTDAYSLVATTGRSACLNCHRVGAVPASEDKGPPLELAFARLRPDWTAHWIANPKRLLTYNTSMPQNFPNGQEDFQELFPGSSLEQLTAARDVLMNLPRVAETPENRSYRAATAGGK